jgi:hypothetical protein
MFVRQKILEIITSYLFWVSFAQNRKNVEREGDFSSRSRVLGTGLEMTGCIVDNKGLSQKTNLTPRPPIRSLSVIADLKNFLKISIRNQTSLPALPLRQTGEIRNMESSPLLNIGVRIKEGAPCETPPFCIIQLYQPFFGDKPLKSNFNIRSIV